MRHTPTLALAEIDTLLLRAALLDGAAARGAYDALRARFDLDALDYGRQRLLPLLHRNLTGFGVDDPLLGRLRGVRHFHWAKNQVLTKAIAPVIADFNAAGIPTILLKGIALLATCLDDMSLRPMDDCDVLVPYAARARAVEVLTAAGLAPAGMPAWSIAQSVEKIGPSIGFFNSAGLEIDLHWHVLHLDCRPSADESFWSRACAIDFAGLRSAVLDPADQVLHAICHGARWNQVSTLRWASDATIVLRSVGAAFDWDRLASEAIVRRCAWPILAALSYLQRHLDVAVPEAVVRALKPHAGPLASVEHRLRIKQLPRLPPAARAYLRFAQFRRNRDDLMRRPLFASFASYLRYCMGARTRREFIALFLFFALGRPGWMRRILRIDASVRSVDAAALPSLGAPFVPANSGPSPLLRGWSNPELAGVWADSAEATLGWRLPGGAVGDVDCEIDIGQVWLKSRPRVDLWANDHLIDRWWGGGPPSTKPIELRVRVPGRALRGRDALLLTFASARRRPPSDLEAATENRPLFLYLRQVKLGPAPVRAGAPVRDNYRELARPFRFYLRTRHGARNAAAFAALRLFAALGSSRDWRRRLRIDRWARYVDARRLPAIDDAFPPAPAAEMNPCLGGWGPPEPGGCWTVAGEARAAWRLPHGFAGGLECDVLGWTLQKPGLAPPAIAILANDRQIAQWQGGSVEAHRLDVRLQIPAEALHGAEALVLVFAVDPLRSPAELGLSADTRTLGLFVERIRFSRSAA